ncbi:MAG: peptidyl-prolyl cis-trans isomerase cyclophilin type [Solirubrobacteraceae bacterium]|nr:peptidyl-prolyl cis-trans isomerase cyclophilin type [Solirubrobacteraceae bacterium]
MSKSLAVIALVLVLAAVGCGKDTKSTTAASTSATATTAASTTTQPKDAAGCVIVAAPKPRGPGTEKKPSLRLSAGKAYVVTLKTNCGEITIALDVKRAPKTTSSFAALVKKGFYDGLTFHRVLADFVIQGGDPLGNGQGGPGYNIVEKPPKSLRYTRGVVAMAKAGVDPSGASGSQFFIVTAEDAGLTPDYALVGKVKSGFGTINRIIAQPVNGPEGTPQNPIVIEKATIDPAP